MRTTSGVKEPVWPSAGQADCPSRLATPRDRHAHEVGARPGPRRRLWRPQPFSIPALGGAAAMVRSSAAGDASDEGGGESPPTSAEPGSAVYAGDFPRAVPSQGVSRPPSIHEVETHR